MFKSEAEQVIKRLMEETKAEFTDEQVACLAKAIIKITGIMLEEATAAMRNQAPGSPPKFFSS